MNLFTVNYGAGGFGQVLAKFRDQSDAKRFIQLWIRGHFDQVWVQTNDINSIDLQGLDKDKIISILEIWIVPESKNLLIGEGEFLILCESSE